MSTKVIADQSVNLESVRRDTAVTRTALSWTKVAEVVLGPLASLKLTVLLLILSVFVVWLATMEQTRVDFWTVKQRHFPELFVFIQFQTLFPPAWFPQLQNLPAAAGFFIPSGFFLISAMLVNLTAAHALRIRIQARGMRLVSGLLVAVLGAVVTWMVIFNGQNPNGFQAEPPISFRTMWWLMQVLLLGLSVSLGSICWTLKADRSAERILAGGLSGLLLATVVFVAWVGERAFIGESAMRILWQLLQGTIAALALLAGCQLLFRRKAGIVLVHAGIALLMLNELYVTMTNVEQRMAIAEGETASFAIDIRSVELVVANTEKSDACELITIPARMWIHGDRISHERLPFDLECVRYEPSTEITAADSADNLATTGIGTSFAIQPFRATAGTDSEQRADMAGGYFRIFEKGTQRELGTYLVSQIVYEEGVFDHLLVDGRDYILGMRFEHYYKPYQIRLLDAQQVNYVGTTTARHFESRFLLSDPERGLHDLEKRVYMNNPMRYGDETFYQASMDQLSSGRDYTVLQIVKNRGWMIPYVACMFVVIGLVAQFGSVLLKYLEQQRKNLISSPMPAGMAAESRPRSPLQAAAGTWIVAWIAFGLALGYVAYSGRKAASETVVKDGKRLDRFGSIPIVHKGRIQPLESLARNTARQMGNRETVTVVGGKKVPAIQWLADLIFDPQSDSKYQVIRIDDLELLAALGLPQRSGFKYTLQELNEAEERLAAALADVRKRPEEQRTPYDKRVIAVNEKIHQLKALRDAMGDPAQNPDESNPFQRLIKSSQLASLELPLAVRTDHPQSPWITIRSAYDLRWLQTLANQHMAGDIPGLGDVLLNEYWLKPQIIERLVRDPDLLDLLKAQAADTNPDTLRQQILARWDQFPQQIFQTFAREIEAEAAASMNLAPGQFATQFKAMVTKFVEQNGGTQSLMAPLPQIAQDLTDLGTAYRSAEPQAFNAAVDRHLDKMRSAETTSGNWRGIKLELFYNRFSPLYLAMVLYLFGLALTALSWIGWSENLRRAAMTINGLALLVHVAAVVLRILISGRPPVTSLYGSFVVVSAVGVILLLIVERITRLGIGNLLASLSAFTALLWAWTISIVDGDTFAVLVAVLDTQFWLSTHVIAISVGYAATMVAGFLGIAFLIGTEFTRRIRPEQQKTFSALIYGIVCFALLFSFFGTVLGGLWADDSWGRFWGWDPKENGALMIVLWNAAILHARWAGIARARGVAALSVLGCAVTIWSWEGVNQLGVGMHTYGFSEDRLTYVALFAAANVLFAAAAYGFSWWTGARRKSLNA